MERPGLKSAYLVSRCCQRSVRVLICCNYTASFFSGSAHNVLLENDHGQGLSQLLNSVWTYYTLWTIPEHHRLSSNVVQRYDIGTDFWYWYRCILSFFTERFPLWPGKFIDVR